MKKANLVAPYLNTMGLVEKEVLAVPVKVKQGKRSVTMWKNAAGKPVSTEDFGLEYYENLGYSVMKCKNNLIASLISTFLFPVIQDPTDPEIALGMRHSTRGITFPDPVTPEIHFLLPKDFGGPEYYSRRKIEISQLLDELSKSDLLMVFTKFLEPSTGLRDYLWVNEDYFHDLTRHALEVIPKQTILNMIHWAIQDYRIKKNGWPNLLASKDSEFIFIYVKSPKGKVSNEQRHWIESANNIFKVPCELLRLNII